LPSVGSFAGGKVAAVQTSNAEDWHKSKKISRASALLKMLRVLPATLDLLGSFSRNLIEVAMSAFGLFLPRLGPHVQDRGSAKRPTLSWHADKFSVTILISVVIIVDVHCTKSQKRHVSRGSARKADVAEMKGFAPGAQKCLCDMMGSVRESIGS
jgi:hypothetical protein